MTDKEKEAIEEIGLIIESFYNFPNPISIDLKDKDVKFLETVLDLIQTQQAEIEQLKNNNKDLLRKLRNRVKEVKKLTKYSLYKKEFSTLNKKLQQKNKIIDEVIGFLATRTWATCPNEDCGANLDCENRCSNDDNIYEECWKMYFERKVETEEK